MCFNRIISKEQIEGDFNLDADKVLVQIRKKDFILV